MPLLIRLSNSLVHSNSRASNQQNSLHYNGILSEKSYKAKGPKDKNISKYNLPSGVLKFDVVLLELTCLLTSRICVNV